MSYDVKVKIDLVQPVGSMDWGCPLIVCKTANDIAYAEYSDITEVLNAGYTTGTGGYKMALTMFSQKNPPEKIAIAGFKTLGTTVLANLMDKNWRRLVITNVTDAFEQTTVKAMAEACDRMFFVGVNGTDAEAMNAALTAFNGYDHVVAVVNKTDADKAAAALCGEVSGHDVGSITYKNLILTGVTPDTFTDSEVEAIHTAGGICILKKAGDVVTSEGIVTSGEYADIIDCKDYIIQQLTYQTQKLLNQTDKIPYDHRGIALLEEVAIGVLNDAYARGMVAEDDEGAPLFTVSYASREEVASGDIAQRKYRGGRFAFTLAGAVHNVDVTGEITVA